MANNSPRPAGVTHAGGQRGARRAARHPAGLSILEARGGRPVGRRRLLRRVFDDLVDYIPLTPPRRTLPLGDWVDAGVSVVMLVVNPVFGSIQRGPVERALDAFRAALAP